MHNHSIIGIDGSEGEGGGQILRTALGLSIVTGKPFRITRIRARRSKPGLLRQHLCGVLAARDIGLASVEGAQLGSQELLFWPTANRAGAYHFAIGTAGSTALVLQAILPALLKAASESEVVLEGGTHNPSAPGFEFLARAYAPLLSRMGAGLALDLERRGFYPAGGGRVVARVRPAHKWQPLHLSGTGPEKQWRATAVLSALDRAIGERELAALRKLLPGLRAEQCQLLFESQARGPGNALLLEALGPDGVVEVFSGIGQRGVSAEQVAQGVVDEARAWLSSGAAIGEWLGDQLMLPLALGAGGSYTTSLVSEHARSNARTIERFLSVRIDFAAEGAAWRVRVQPLH